MTERKRLLPLPLQSLTSAYRAMPDLASPRRHLAMPRRTKPRPAAPNLTRARPALPDPAMPNLAAPRPTRPRPTSACLAAPRHSEPHHAQPSLAMPHQATPCPAMPCLTTPHRAVPDLGSPCPAAPDRALPRPTSPHPASPDPAQPGLTRACLATRASGYAGNPMFGLNMQPIHAGLFRTYVQGSTVFGEDLQAASRGPTHFGGSGLLVHLGRNWPRVVSPRPGPGQQIQPVRR